MELQSEVPVDSPRVSVFGVNVLGISQNRFLKRIFVPQWVNLL